MLSGNVDVRVHRRRRGVQPVLGAGHAMFIWLGKDRLSLCGIARRRYAEVACLMPTELGVCHFRLASVGQAPADPKLTTVNKDVTIQLKHSLQYSAHAICTMHTGTKEKKRRDIRYDYPNRTYLLPIPDRRTGHRAMAKVQPYSEPEITTLVRYHTYPVDFRNH